jgi:hypothetical protein
MGIIAGIHGNDVAAHAGSAAAQQGSQWHRAIAEGGDALLKTTFRALRNVSVDPWRIGRISAAAMVLLPFDQARTT